MPDGTEPILDEELLYRRVPVSQKYYRPGIDKPASPEAFRPNKNRDQTGLSVFRAKYVSPEEVAQNDRGSKYFVAVLRAGDLRSQGIEVVPRPTEEAGPGHAELPGLRSENRRETEGEQKLLARKLSLEILGPYP